MNENTRIWIGRWLQAVFVLGAVLTGVLAWRENLAHPRTNDAMVRANIVDIAPQHASGLIVELHVADNQRVKQGDLLYVIDPRPYQAKLDQARAKLQLAEKAVESDRALIEASAAKVRQTEQERLAAEAEIARLRAKAGFDQSYLDRIKPLLAQEFVTANKVNEATAARDASAAALRDAVAKQRAATLGVDFAHKEHLQAEANLAQFGEVFAKIEAARAEVRGAELDVEYCAVRAPFDAYVTNLNTAVGEYVQPGQKLFALVDDRDWYVVANYKETYLEHIQPGMAVDVFLVPYPGQRFRGEVQGIGWANYPDNIKEQGSLPTVERTLNWVVLASRFPVRIKLLDRDPRHPFRMGMTAFTTVVGTGTASGPP
ncbi:membrane fusion protein, multidrug efflux system [Methylomagnum ishizawai]|uniref:Membrane fusion protein, multidrug efflux system n=1 Tax=Methylomagnum ishizawai TaxID=1760988 RepID=A0A1Y6CXR4_9GAMM|nr:biotin/lipoyl-binding protein [Methylomagnum ishizawai]SMF95076.1 membrane fusion protein, multidrug efflux system [Methylomagnum ishizawai]